MTRLQGLFRHCQDPRPVVPTCPLPPFPCTPPRAHIQVGRHTQRERDPRPGGRGFRDEVARLPEPPRGRHSPERDREASFPLGSRGRRGGTGREHGRPSQARQAGRRRTSKRARAKTRGGDKNRDREGCREGSKSEERELGKRPRGLAGQAYKP